jgi:hypothetical protein
VTDDDHIRRVACELDRADRRQRITLWAFLGLFAAALAAYVAFAVWSAVT